jgi:D-alanyl-D-alanine dipeptidase
VKLLMLHGALLLWWAGQKQPHLLCPTARKLIIWQKPGIRGLADYQEVLISEDALLQAELANTAMHSRGYVLDVSLVKALGGGFESSSTFDAQVKP